MKYYIIAGEASGDLHGSNLIKALKEKDTEAQFRCWGGDLMAAEGVDLIKHYRDLAFMGFLEVLLNIRKILKNIAFCKKDITECNPDVLVFIDYPGFNLRIAEWAKKKGYTTYYYISPQVWAWKENRVKAIKRDVDHMYVILPFEKGFYEKKHHYPVHFVGHPLIDAISDRPLVNEYEFRAEHRLDDHRPIVALLPGSRKQEIRTMLKYMVSVVPYFKEGHQFVIAGAPSQDYSLYQPFVDGVDVHYVYNRTYDLLSVSMVALVTSGTATLETALHKVPEVVCYKGNWFSYQIAKRVIHLEFISSVNLIMGRAVVQELIQNQLNAKNLQRALTHLLDPYQRAKMFIDYYDLEKKLGGQGASEKVASLLLDSKARELTL